MYVCMYYVWKSFHKNIMPGEILAFFTMGKLNSFFFLELLSEKMYIISKSNNKWHQKTQ